MFARSVSIRLKPDSIAALTKLMEDETLPMPRKQKGFQNEIAFFGPGRMEQKEQLQGAA